MKNLKLGQRLISLFMVMALIVALTGGFGAWSMKMVGDRIQGMLTNLAAIQKWVLLMEVAQKDCHINLLHAITLSTDPEKFEEHSEDYQMKRDLFRSQCETLLKGNAKLGIKAGAAGERNRTEGQRDVGELGRCLKKLPMIFWRQKVSC